MLRRLQKRRLWVNPPVINPKMSSWAVKPAWQRNPARPNAPPRDTVGITDPSQSAPRSAGDRCQQGLGPNYLVLGLVLGLRDLNAHEALDVGIVRSGLIPRNHCQGIGPRTLHPHRVGRGKGSEEPRLVAQSAARPRQTPPAPRAERG